MKVNEAREVVLMWHRAGSTEGTLAQVLDAYGDARELKGHIDAHGYEPTVDKVCGQDGYLCERATELEELGR